jgi:tRNA U55 pseudouridine synthase TruB
VRELRRTRSGPFEVALATAFEVVERAARGDASARTELDAAMIPVERGLPGTPRLSLDEVGVQHARAGRVIPVAHAVADGAAVPAAGTEPVLLLDASGVAVALARVEDAGLRVVRGFVASTT